jgi:predicted Na+-dependent transporter
MKEWQKLLLIVTIQYLLFSVMTLASTKIYPVKPAAPNPS